ncbi:MAG: ROK family protein [Acidobacteriota bacterium]|nr:ROK family protein [Acidobacteriota bacterium]
MPELTLGVDLSDLVARVVVVNDAGQVLSRGHLPPAAGNPAHALRDTVKRAMAGAGGKVTASAVALPQPGDPVAADFAAMLAEAAPGARAAVPIAAGTAAAIAEQWCGAARGLKQVITCAIGEHVTAGVLINGEPWLGAHGLAGSICWLALNPVEREDYRRYGGLEAEVASAGIVRRLVWRIKSGDRSSVADNVGGDLTRLTADDVFQGARVGDGVCISVVRDTAKYVGMAVANLVTMLDPEAVVLGGTIAASGDMMLEAIRLECSRRLRPAQSEHVRIVLSTLGADAVAIGAARAAARPPA